MLEVAYDEINKLFFLVYSSNLRVGNQNAKDSDSVSMMAWCMCFVA